MWASLFPPQKGYVPITPDEIGLPIEQIKFYPKFVKEVERLQAEKAKKQAEAEKTAAA